MHERLLLVEHSVALLLLFTAIGSGPATGLIHDRLVRLATMPILGFALAASLLTTAAPFLTMATATWVVLIPAAIVSLAITLVLARRRPGAGRLREIAIPAAVLLVGVTLALMPPVFRGTQGPFSLYVWDAWGYTGTSLFLQHHSTSDLLPAGVARTDVTMWYGAKSTSGGQRIGVDAVNASAATLLRSDTGATLAPLLAVLFGLFPVAVWLITRGLGASWQAAAFGSAFGLTPAILSLVEDTTLGNLAGGVLAAPALFFIVRSVRGSVADAIVAGALIGGLAAVYPEFLVPLLIVAACVGLVFGLDRVDHGALRKWVRLGATRVGIAAVTTIVVAPVAISRAIQYLSSRTSDGPWTISLPLRYINVENVGSWLFGLRHLYEMSSTSALPASHLAFAIYFPVVLAIVVFFGIARLRVLGVFVAAPILVAGTLGVLAYQEFQAGRCEYCLWKSLTFMIPFLAVGLAFGLERIWHGTGTQGFVFLRRGLAASIAIVALVAIGNSDKKLVQTTRSVGNFCPCELRDLGKRLDRLPSRAPILIEGTGAMPQPYFIVPAAYFAVRGHKQPVHFDVGTPPTFGVAYLGLTPDSAVPYYSPNYGYVLTPFMDVRSNRTPLGRYGPLLLERRAPIDVVVSPFGWAVDNTAPRIPWVSRPFRLRVSSRKAVDAAITISLARPTGGTSTLTFASGPKQLKTIATNRSEVCVNVHLRKGSTDIEATPVLDQLTVQVRKELGLAAIEAVPGRCGTGRLAAPVSFYDGWFPVEQHGDGSSFRWMASVGTIEVGTPGTPRPSVRIDAQATSLVRRRRVDVWLGEKRLASFDVPPTPATKITVVVPPGRGVARILLIASPAAEPASIVSPSDSRLLSIALSDISIRPGVSVSKRP